MRGSALLLRRCGFTIALIAAILIVAIATDTLLNSASAKPWYSEVATGIPAFAEGRWWTLATAIFFLDAPSSFVFIAPLLVFGMAFAEWRLGTRRTIAVFIGGHLVGVLGASLAILALSGTHMRWITELALERDVGPSCGAFACLAFALATLPAPWRLRTRFALGAWAVIEVFYIGEIANVEHAVAIAAGLTVSGLLPAYRRPLGRPSTREWRLIAFAGLIGIVFIQVLDLIVPSNGPFGDSLPDASTLDVAIDALVIVVVANGVRVGVRVAWISAITLAVFNILTAVFGYAFAPMLIRFKVIDSPSELIGLILAPGVLWAVALIVLLLGRGAFEVRLRRSRRVPGGGERLSRDEALERLKHLGGGTISWMIGWPLNQYLAVGEGADAGVVAFQVHSGVAIAVGDPVASPGKEGRALTAFANECERAGLIPCVFSASSRVTRALPAGWRQNIIAEDTIVDLPGLSLASPAWKPVRTSVHKAEREGIEFRLTRLADEPWAVRAQARTISEKWAGDKELPEMRFTLGTLDEAMDRDTRVGLALDADGSLHGITSWLPVYGPGGFVRGWTLDLMRRRDDGFGPVMEFLIASSALAFSAEGAEFVSLSGAPLVRPEGLEEGPVDQVLARLGNLIEPLYGFKSLHRFKQKFNPRSDPLSLLYRDEGDLPRIAVALTRAYLPDASLWDLVSSAAPLRR